LAVTIDLIASRRFRATRSGGDEFEIELGVGRPVQCGDDEWKCGVLLKGLYEHLADQHGVDSWQALMLAQNLARQLLAAFIEDGGQLLDVDTGSVIVRVEEIFRHGTGR
jgi:hypothetical protein